MIKRVLVASAIVCSTAAALASGAAAQQNTPLTNDGNGYFRLAVGAWQPTDTGYSFSNSVSGFGITVTETISGDIESDPGLAANAAIGYRFNKSVSFEAEFGHAKADLDSATVNQAITFTAGGASLAVAGGSGSVDLDGDVSATTGVANIIADIPTGGFITPYIGAGAGLVAWKAKLNSISSGGSTLIVNGEDDGTDLTANLIAGLNFNFSEKVNGGIRYKYIWTDTGTSVLDDVTAHALQASLTFHF